MLSTSLIGLMFGLGAATWVYNKMMQRSGGNTQNSLIVAAIAGFFGFLLVLTVMSFLGNFLEE